MHQNQKTANEAEIGKLTTKLTEKKADLEKIEGDITVARKDYSNITHKLGEQSQALAVAEKNHQEFIKYESATRKELKAKEEFLASKEEELAAESRHLASRRAALGNLSS